MKVLSRSSSSTVSIRVAAAVTTAAVTLMVFRVFVVAQENEVEARTAPTGVLEKRLVTEPCDLGKFDDRTRNVLTTVNWKVAADETQYLHHAESIRSTITVRREYGDFLERYGKALEQVAGPYDFEPYSRGLTITAFVPEAMLCDLSLQPEVQRVEWPGPPPIPL